MTGFSRGLVATVATLALSAGLADVASAQTSTLTEWQNSPGIVMRPLGGPIPDWQVTVGGGIGAMPAYEGSNSTRLTPAPDVDVRYKDLAFASIGEGVGVNILRGTNYRAGVAMSYDMGREHNLATRLKGTQNVDPAPVIKAFAEYTFLPVVFTIDVKQALTSYQGLSGDIGAYLPVVGNATVQIFVGPELTFADTRYMNAYFGVDPQSASSQSTFRNYGAHGGLKDAKFGASGFYHFNEHWFVNGDVGVERLLGSAEDSPIVQTRWGITAAATINYTF
jgi:outer membrane scaffolding protein for murein synthesis (MipA/OmpV family)